MGLLYFIADDGNSIVALDCEESLKVSKKNSVSESSVMSGSTVSDGYKEGNKVVALSGKVTYNKSAAQQQQGTPDPLEIQNLLDTNIRNHTRFKLYADQSGFALLKDIDTCIIEDYTVDVQHYTDTIILSMVIKEVFVSDAATTTTLPPRPDTESAKSDSDPTSGKGGKQVVAEEENATILHNFVNKGSFSGN